MRIMTESGTAHCGCHNPRDVRSSRSQTPPGIRRKKYESEREVVHNWPPGPGSSNTNCATANSNGLSCSVFAGAPGVLTYDNGNTFIGLGVSGKASDTGVGGLAGGSNYTGGFSEFFTTPILVNGVLVAPTPQNIQLYFCPTGVCQPSDFTSGKTITSSQSGTFTASRVAGVPEPGTISMSLFGG
jgi:hypothetical protein